MPVFGVVNLVAPLPVSVGGRADRSECCHECCHACCYAAGAVSADRCRLTHSPMCPLRMMEVVAGIRRVTVRSYREAAFASALASPLACSNFCCRAAINSRLRWSQDLMCFLASASTRRALVGSPLR